MTEMFDEDRKITKKIGKRIKRKKTTKTNKSEKDYVDKILLDINMGKVHIEDLQKIEEEGYYDE